MHSSGMVTSRHHQLADLSFQDSAGAGPRWEGSNLDRTPGWPVSCPHKQTWLGPRKAPVRSSLRRPIRNSLRLPHGEMMGIFRGKWLHLAINSDFREQQKSSRTWEKEGFLLGRDPLLAVELEPHLLFQKPRSELGRGKLYIAWIPHIPQAKLHPKAPNCPKPDCSPHLALSPLARPSSPAAIGTVCKTPVAPALSPSEVRTALRR